MKRAQSEQKDKKTYHSNFNKLKESNKNTDLDADNFLVLRNNLNNKNPILKGNPNKLNISATNKSKSNFSNKPLLSKDFLLKNTKLNYPISIRSNTEGITRNSSVDRIKYSNIKSNANNSNRVLNKEIISTKRNTGFTINKLEKEAFKNIPNKPKIMNDKYSANIKPINIPVNNAVNNKNKFSNIDPSIDQKYNKPSDKFQRIKYSDPFSTAKKHKTNFGYVYSAGGVPCRIEHGPINMKIKWDIEPEHLDFDPILIVCFEGLMEIEHPFSFTARQCVREMMLCRNGREKILPILSKLINPLRNALGTISDGMFSDSLDITRILSELVKENLNPFLHFFLQQINKKAFSAYIIYFKFFRKFREKVFDLLHVLEKNGGDDALKEIKKKIPTYVSLL